MRFAIAWLTDLSYPGPVSVASAKPCFKGFKQTDGLELSNPCARITVRHPNDLARSWNVPDAVGRVRDNLPFPAMAKDSGNSWD